MAKPLIGSGCRGYACGIGRGMNVLDGTGDRPRRKGNVSGEFGASHCNQWGLCGVISHSLP